MFGEITANEKRAAIFKKLLSVNAKRNETNENTFNGSQRPRQTWQLCVL